MEVYRRSSWLFFLLGLFFLTATLPDVQGEVDGQGPTESECRPYIEKALKELEGENSEHPDIDLNTKDSVEELQTIEITNDDSGHSDEDGIAQDQDSPEANQTNLDDSKEDEDEQTGEIDDDDESNELETVVEETQQQNESKENEISVENQIEEDPAQSSEKDDTNEDEGEEKKEDETVIDTNLSDEQQGEDLDSLEDETATDENTSEEEILDIREREILNSIEVYLEEEEQILTSREREILNSNDDEILSRVVREISSKEEESVTSAEEKIEKEESATSVEEDAPASVEKEESASAEAATEADKEESAETSLKSEEEDDTPSIEKKTTSAEKSTEEDTASTEKEESADTEDGGASLEKEEGTQSEENEASKEKDESAPSEEKEGSAEIEGAPSAEKEEAQSEEKEDSVASVEKEDTGASVEKEDASASVEKEDSATSVEKEDIAVSVEKEEATSAQKEESSEKEQGATSVEEVVSAENVTGVDHDPPTSSTRDEDKERTDSGEKSMEESESVVEELVQELEDLADLRPRDHVNQILKLDEESTQTESIATKLSDVILKDLKRLYENAIKPLETLYKYRDLSNRHFGDAEIFSKPLILFMGPWSGGKSSIINYLLNIEYNETSLHTGAEPSPAYFNILVHGDEPEILDGTELAADYTFSGLQKFGQGLEERLRGYKLPSKLLEKVNIVEIPGILEVRKQVSRVFPFNDACQWFIDRADIIFLVYDPSKLDVGPETEAILDQLKGREYQTRIVLNKADQIKPEELMRVQGALIWNISPLMSSAQPPVMYTTSLWSKPYESWAPVRLLQAQERAFLKDLRLAVEKRIDNKIASARRFAVRVRNHAKMVDCYLTTYYNHKSVFGNRKHVSDEIINHPQDYHIYEGLSTLTNISRYDLPDPDVYKDFFKLNALYEFQQLSATCTYFRGCPINRLDVAIAYDLPELVGKHKRLIETTLNKVNTAPTPDS